jgi:lysophospholipase L1-like esterase
VPGADALVVQGGINDIAQKRSVADAAANLRTMVRRGKELGLRVAIVDVLPWNNGWPDAEPQIRRLNALIAELARDESTALLSFHDTLEDPDHPGGCGPTGPRTAITRPSRATAGSVRLRPAWRTTARRRRRRRRARRRREAAAPRGDG